MTDYIYTMPNIFINRENSGNTSIVPIPNLAEIWIMPNLKDLPKHLALCEHILSHYELSPLSLRL